MRGFDIIAEITNARDCHKSALKIGKPGKRRGGNAQRRDVVATRPVSHFVAASFFVADAHSIG
jgi:hypothetical protein